MKLPMKRTVLLCVLCLSGAVFADDMPLTLSIAGKKPALEKSAKAAFEKLLTTYDLSRFHFTRVIRFEDGVIPHSHPTLTLNTNYIDEADKMLTTYIHEQLHWWLNEHPEAEKAVIGEFRSRYPVLPTDRRELARDEYSTYIHLIVCYFELIGLREVRGEAVAHEVFDWLKGHHYRWIYRTVLEDEVEIAAILARHGLKLPWQ